eukprot:COSAG05_NODE_719_length_7779_cov_30.552214_9_plen_687_part_01
MPLEQTPFFLSSRTNAGSNSQGTRFDVNLNPSFKIPDNATSARAFVHSATIPYVFPNVVAGKNTLRVILPTKLVGGTREATVTIPVGLYTLFSGEEPDIRAGTLETVLNKAVNRLMHDDVTTGNDAFDSHGLMSSDSPPVANFCTIRPNFILNRAELTLNHPRTGIDFTHAASTMKVLGFTEELSTRAPRFTVGSSADALNLSVTSYHTGGPYTVTIALDTKTYETRELEDAINGKTVAALAAHSPALPQYNIIKPGSLTVITEPQFDTTGDYEGFKLMGKFEYDDSTRLQFTFYNDSDIRHDPHHANLGDPSGQNAVLADNTTPKVMTVAVLTNQTDRNNQPISRAGAGYVQDDHVTWPTVRVGPATGINLGATAHTIVTQTDASGLFLDHQSDESSGAFFGPKHGTSYRVTSNVPCLLVMGDGNVQHVIGTGDDVVGAGLTIDITAVDSNGAITSAAINQAGTGYLDSRAIFQVQGGDYNAYLTVSVSGMGGSGLTVRPTTTTGGSVDTLDVIDSVRGYAVGDAFQVMPTVARPTMAPSNIGKVHGLDLTLLARTGTHMYDTATNVPTRNVRQDVCTGKGLTVDITADNHGTITHCTVNNQGYGYVEGDEVVIVQVGNSGTATVPQGFGCIVVVTLLDPAYPYARAAVTAMGAYNGYQVSSILGTDRTADPTLTGQELVTSTNSI